MVVDWFEMYLLCLLERPEEWELGASSKLTGGTKGGLIRLTRRVILVMNGRSRLPVLPMPKELFWRKCK